MPNVAKKPTLEQNGPTIATEFDTDSLTPNQRAHGVTRFTISELPKTETATGVFYLYGEHSAEDILQAYFDANPHLLDAYDATKIARWLGEHGQSYQKAWERLRDDLSPTAADHSSATA